MIQGVRVEPQAPPSTRRIRTTAPPDPLPDAWARAIATSIANELRHGWKSSTARRAINSRGAPITGRDYQPAGHVPGPTPTSELVSRELYAWALTDEIPALDVPALLWHVTQLDLAQALIERDLMQHAGVVDAWLRHQPRKANRPPSLYRLKPNRHGRLTLRRNSDHTPTEVTSVFLTAAAAATVTIPNPLDLDDALAEWETIDLEAVINATG